MKQNNTLRCALAVAVIAVMCFTHLSAQHFTPARKLESAERIIEGFYVDSVDANHIVEEGIIAMLKNLDPHSAYSNPEETRELNEPLQGNFSGIGIQFNMATDTVYVLQTIAGGPSEKVGILPGDRIIAANDTVLAGKKMRNSEVMKHLRGPKGSEVKLTVIRPGEKEPINFIVTRDMIPIHSVDSYYMAAPKVGYIRISRFGENTPREIIEAIINLQKEGMKDLILDLEDNGGGYLTASTDIAEMLLDRGDLLLFTKGRMQEPAYYKASRKGFFKGKVAVMVNQYSASASEILSGAIQDHDRGVIVGRRTFGKGLVQRPFNMPDGSMIRLTVARYYTPSGRCIQKPYKSGEEDSYRKDILNRYEHGELMNADSIHQTGEIYYTLKKHRPVYGGGGITPDYFVPVDTTGNTAYYRKIVARGLLNKYVMRYLDKNRESLKNTYAGADAFVNDFEVTPEMLGTLTDMATADSIAFDEKQFDESKQVIATVIKGLIGRDVFGDNLYMRIVNPMNPSFRQALDIITDNKRYDALLARPKK